MKEDKNGFKYPKIDEKLCLDCGLCSKACPVINKLKENLYNIKVYACKNKDENIRKKSSSGGLFTLFAKYILDQEGVVFGAKYDENLRVIHDYIEKDDVRVYAIEKFYDIKVSVQMMSKVRSSRIIFNNTFYFFI